MPYPEIISVHHCLTFADQSRGFINDDDVINTQRLYNNAQSLCQQLERATEVQNALRNKQVKEYQEQIQKAIEQEDKARKAGILALF